MTTQAISPRCVVTGYSDGQSQITHDGTVTNINSDLPGVYLADIYATQTMPVDLQDQFEKENTVFPKVDSNGSYFRYITIPPEKELFSTMNIDVKTGKPHPFMHATDTLDYIIVTQGEMYLILDKEETLLKAGDVVIQRGTNHSWSNRSDKPCSFFVVLLDAKAWKGVPTPELPQIDKQD